MSHQGKFDGISVDQFMARFSGTFDVDDYDAMHQAIDGEVMFVVVARVKGATITETSSGDIRRTNSLKLQQIKAVRKQVDREELADKFALDLPMQLPIEAAAREADAAPPVIVPLPELPSPDEYEYEPEEEDEDDFVRVSVGGAAKNDAALARFLATP